MTETTSEVKKEQKIKQNYYPYLAVVVTLLLIGLGLTLASVPNTLSAGQFSIGYFAAGEFSVGVFAVGTFAVGVFAAGIFAVGLFSVGIFSLGIWSVGLFVLAVWAKSRGLL